MFFSDHRDKILNWKSKKCQFSGQFISWGFALYQPTIIYVGLYLLGILTKLKKVPQMTTILICIERLKVLPRKL